MLVHASNMRRMQQQQQQGKLKDFELTFQLRELPMSKRGVSTAAGDEGTAIYTM